MPDIDTKIDDIKTELAKSDNFLVRVMEDFLHIVLREKLIDESIVHPKVHAMLSYRAELRTKLRDIIKCKESPDVSN